ncbi:hypothetical protein JNJ66_02375 [Candidatus Saccharibacteria bacterium]|nr:hypothetical protein [Candidatus Saccharibacteria bacterium]
MAKTKTDTIKREVYLQLSIIAAITLLVLGGLAFWGHRFIGDMVQTELAAQKVYFPEKGSPAFDPAEYGDIQHYAGQLVDTPAEARAYANGFIGRHLQKVADGKVYAEVSAAAMKNPDDKKLQQQKQTLFQGETLRGLLLTSGYGIGTAGEIAGIAAYAAFALSGGLLLIAATLRSRS